MNDYFENAPVPKAYMKLALPVIATMVFSLIYNLTDTFFVAYTGNSELVAGVSVCYPLFLLMLALGDIFAMGGSSLVARLFGEKDIPSAKRISAFCFYGVILTGLILTAVLLIFREGILAFLGAGPDTYEHASSYYTVIALGAPFVCLSYVPVNMLRCEGMSGRGMIANVTGTLVNIVLDPILILLLNMGAAGAALATVLGNIITDIISILYVLKKSRNTSFSIRSLNLKEKHIPQLFLLGFPVAITNLTASFGTAMLNRHLYVYGTNEITAMGIASKIGSIVLLVLVGGSFGGAPIVGYNYGAGNGKRLKEILRFALFFEIGIAAVISGILMLLAPQVMGIFMKNDTVITLGAPMLRRLLVSMPVVALILVLSILFQATGRALPAMILSLCRQGVLFALVITVMDSLFGYSGVICSQAVSDILTGILAAALLMLVRKKIFTNQRSGK